MLKLDDRDIRILSVLSRDGRLSKADLARAVNLSATACWQRLRRLEDAGVIRGYRAEIELKAVAGALTVFLMVELDSHRADSFKTFERVVQSYDEVIGCWAIGGGFDYLLQVMARDIEAYQAMIDEWLEQRIGLARYFTYVVTKSIKTPGALPLERLLGSAKTD